MGSEFIIYLEPSLAFKQCVEHYLVEMEQKYGTTTANKYGCHISMTGFFNIEQDRINEIKNYFNNNFRSEAIIPEIDLNSIIVYDKTTHTPQHLLLPIKTPQVYHDIMVRLSKMVTLRLKRIDHISLAYWDEPQATIEEINNWNERKRNLIFENMKEEADIYFKNMQSPLKWDIVLYERVYKGILVTQRHQFKELGRWPSSTAV